MRLLRGLALVLGAATLLSCADDQPPVAMAEAPLDGTSSNAAVSDTGQAAPTAPAVAPHLLYPRGPRVMAHDYAIGPLQDLLAAEGAAQAVTATLIPFLRALAQGAIAERAVAPDRLRSLRRSLQYHLKEGALPHAARIGAVIVAEHEAHVAVRLFGETARVAGEIYLEPGAEGWRIVDLQLDLAQLALPYSPREREFVPRSDRWLLLRQ